MTLHSSNLNLKTFSFVIIVQLQFPISYEILRVSDSLSWSAKSNQTSDRPYGTYLSTMEVPQDSVLSPQAICQFFLRGQCKFGSNCRNEHPKDGQRSVFGSACQPLAMYCPFRLTAPCVSRSIVDPDVWKPRDTTRQRPAATLHVRLLPPSAPNGQLTKRLFPRFCVPHGPATTRTQYRNHRSRFGCEPRQAALASVLIWSGERSPNYHHWVR